MRRVGCAILVVRFLDDDGRVIRIYSAAQDITEDMRKAELIDDRTLDPKALSGNLRKFPPQAQTQPKGVRHNVW